MKNSSILLLLLSVCIGYFVLWILVMVGTNKYVEHQFKSEFEKQMPYCKVTEIQLIDVITVYDTLMHYYQQQEDKLLADHMINSLQSQFSLPETNLRSEINKNYNCLFYMKQTLKEHRRESKYQKVIAVIYNLRYEFPINKNLSYFGSMICFGDKNIHLKHLIYNYISDKHRSQFYKSVEEQQVICINKKTELDCF
jgi:hypothetical protein